MAMRILKHASNVQNVHNLVWEIFISFFLNLRSQQHSRIYSHNKLKLCRRIWDIFMYRLSMWYCLPNNLALWYTNLQDGKKYRNIK